MICHITKKYDVANVHKTTIENSLKPLRRLRESVG
jgi:hypothetical protein